MKFPFESGSAMRDIVDNNGEQTRGVDPHGLLHGVRYENRLRSVESQFWSVVSP